MLVLLLYVVIVGVIAWGVSALPMPSPFKTVCYCILIIIMVLLCYRMLTGSGLKL